MDHRPSEDLLESVHSFPGSYQIKVIGTRGEDFTGRVLAAVLEEVSGPSEVEHSIRETPNGRHAAVTLDLTVQSAEQVRAIYERLRMLDGLAMLL